LYGAYVDSESYTDGGHSFIRIHAWHASKGRS
jgi:hypothetical protein